MKAIHYAQALWELESEGKMNEKVLRHFVEVVLRRGHAHLFAKIIVELQRIVFGAERERTIEVVSARPLSESDVSVLLKRDPFKRALSPQHRTVVRKVDQTLIGGAVVKTSTMRVDGSYKRALLDLYQQFIS